tara:strand:- start:5355 stop:5540 length:186 start_codon:yes stop_codon:yes gene_type:complete
MVGRNASSDLTTGALPKIRIGLRGRMRQFILYMNNEGVEDHDGSSMRLPVIAQLFYHEVDV